MNHVGARAGLVWVREGLRIFRLQPLGFCMLFISLLIFKFVLSMLPYVGQALSMVFVPIMAITFMRACIDAEAGKRVTSAVLFSTLRLPTLPRLIVLGLTYLAASVFALWASTWIDGGVFWKMLSADTPADTKTPIDPRMLLGMLSTAVFYAPFMLVLWHAAPLIVWRNMGLAKAIFYSAVTVKRSAAAFVVYGAAWFTGCVMLPSFITALVSLITGSSGAMLMIVLPVSLAVSVATYCSFYPTYTDVFGKPPDASNTGNPDTGNSDISNSDISNSDHSAT